MDSRSNKIFWLPRIGEGLRHLWIFFFLKWWTRTFFSLFRFAVPENLLYCDREKLLVSFEKKSVLKFNYMEGISFSNIVLFLVTSISLVYFAACKKKNGFAESVKKVCC
jgi:hypothetical protein